MTQTESARRPMSMSIAPVRLRTVQNHLRQRLGVKERNSLLAKAFHLDHRKARRLPIEFARNTWDDNIVSFRKALINVERYVVYTLGLIPALGINEVAM
jgi:hypothetical protein